MAAYHEICATAIRSFDGFIAQAVGDGLLIYFGYPEAHEDDAERAVRAGLAIVEALSEHHEPFRRCWPDRAVRIGIQSGLVVTGDAGPGDTRAALATVGAPPDVAARLQRLAGHNWVVIGAKTRQLLSDQFELQALGPQRIDGLDEPLDVWRVLREHFDGHFAVRQRLPLPLLERDAELLELERCWARARQGEGQCVVVSAAAGMGKSRLAAALREKLAAERPIHLHYRCLPGFQHTLLYPLAAELRHSAQLRPGDPARRKLRKLRRVLSVSSRRLDSDVALLAQLLQIPDLRPSAFHERSAQRLLDDTLDFFVEQLEQAARARPTLVVVEDAQWMDPTSQGLVRRILGRLEGMRVLILITTRPPNAWASERVARVLRLEPLEPGAARRLVQHLAQEPALGERVVGEIVARGEGVPLYLEELTRTVLDSESPDRVPSVPTSLQEALTERLDRLGPLKIVAQLGACLGRSFPYRLLREIAGLDEPRLQAGIQRLEATEIISRAGEFPDAVCCFRHALLQSAAYESLPRSERGLVHAKIAETLLRLDPTTRSNEPELLAQHLMAAGQHDAAADDWLRAGLHAQRRCAHRDAVAHLRAGLSALGELPPSPARDAREVDFQIALARSHLARTGWSGPRVHESYARARQLCQATRNARKECEALWGLWSHHAVRGDYARAREIALEHVLLAEEGVDRQALLMADGSALITHFLMGDFLLAQRHADRVHDQYRESEDAQLVHIFNHDPAVMACHYEAIWRWICGLPDSADRVNRRAIERSRRLGHPFQLCFSLVTGSGTLLWWQDVEASLALSDEGLHLAREHRILLFQLYGPLLAASARCARSPSVETVRGLHDCLTAMRTAQGRMFLPLCLLRVAEGHEAIGELTHAEALVQEALEHAQATGERWSTPELHRACARLAGEQRRGADLEERWLESGLVEAKRLGGRSYELRLLCDLYELQRRQGRVPDVHLRLQQLYAGFREGRDTPDIRRARALLRDGRSRL